MKIFDPKRHLPVGWEWESTRFYLTPPSAAGGVGSIPDWETKMLQVRSGQKK